jgi:hypothetical protein
MSSRFQIKVSRNGNEIGSYSVQEVIQLKLNGTLRGTDTYTHDGMFYGGVVHWARVSEMGDDLVLRHFLPDSIPKKVVRFIFALPLCLLGGALTLTRMLFKLSPMILVLIIICRWDELAIFLDRPTTLLEVLTVLVLIVAYCFVWYFITLSECWSELKVYLSPIFEWKVHLPPGKGGPPFGYDD